jgi:TonB family protein
MLKRVSVFGAIIISIFLHSFLSAGLWYAESGREKHARTHSVVEMINTEQPKDIIRPDDKGLLKGQVVDQNEKSLNDEKPVDAKYLSRTNQKVAKETRAQNNGKFSNTVGDNGKPSAENKPPVKNNPPIEKTSPRLAKTQPRAAGPAAPAENEIDPKTASENSENLLLENTNSPIAIEATRIMKPTQAMHRFAPEMNLAPQRTSETSTDSTQASKNDISQNSGRPGQAATDDNLKNVAFGVQTLLNTREFVYYSYYNRIKEKIRYFWEPRIKEKVANIFRQGRNIASTSTDRITRTVITLDRKGVLVKVQVIGPSGLLDLDEAAVDAFKAAAPFPNPPNGIADKDGFIRINWDFVLEASTGPALFRDDQYAQSSN